MDIYYFLKINPQNCCTSLIGHSSLDLKEENSAQPFISYYSAFDLILLNHIFYVYYESF